MSAAQRRRRGGTRGGGAPDWLVTFADLMSILVCFFVLIISFSIQDEVKLQIVAGSMRDAFGIESTARRAGVIEVNGIPLRDHVKEQAVLEQDKDTNFATERHDDAANQGPEASTYQYERADIDRPRHFATAAASLRQALEEMPDFAELSRQIVIEETEEGLNIALVDEDGRSMFPTGSKYPYEHTRRLIARLAPTLRDMPNRLAITGHTAARESGAGGAGAAWQLSADRANAVRALLQEFGVPQERVHGVTGRADTEPLFPNDPFLTANRRIEILLMQEEPPIPVDFKP